MLKDDQKVTHVRLTKNDWLSYLLPHGMSSPGVLQHWWPALRKPGASVLPPASKRGLQ